MIRIGKSNLLPKPAHLESLFPKYYNLFISSFKSKKEVQINKGHQYRQRHLYQEVDECKFQLRWR